MNRWKKLISMGLACVMLAGTVPVMAESVSPETETVTLETETVTLGETNGSQMTMEDLAALNGRPDAVYSHDGKVTFVDGTCSADPVTGQEDASEVVASMMTLIGADANTEFIPWRTVTDPLGNIYYIFQQMFHDTTVCGGAVKVITDAEGKMIGLTSSVESKMPEVAAETGITAEDAEKIVVKKQQEADGRIPEILSQYTGKVILPSTLKFDIESEDETSRFAWVVYSVNPSGNVKEGSDLPYLAHYVAMNGEYLYNMPAIAPDDAAGRSGYDSSYVFEFMEPVDYTGYVDLSDGTEKKITVTLMRDTRTGMYYLGNIERKIVVAECYDFLYNDGQLLLEASIDNKEWDQVGLLSLYNYCRAWDYYNAIGWRGGDGEGTPIVILNNFCDDHYNEVNNACYVGKVNGMQAFLASKINDYSQCLDVIAHEFTHCVTGSLMTYNSYMNDYGAINEGMSDVQGKNCEMMYGEVDVNDWTIGANSVSPIRDMRDPHRFSQPEYTWDLYYMSKVETPTPANDHGGVHFNSSLFNRLAYFLVGEGGMTLDEARIFWFMTDCAMVPQTDYAQLAELLPWVLKAAGMEQYQEILDKAIKETRIGVDAMPDAIGDDRAVLRVSLPDTEAFDAGNWMMTLTTVKLEELVDRAITIFGQLINKDYSGLPETLQQLMEEEDLRQEQKAAEMASKPKIEALLDVLTEVMAEAKADETETAGEASASPEDLIKEMMIEWLQDELSQLIFSSYGFAGQDGSTMNMVVRPGRCIPVMQHVTMAEGSETPDQVVVAVYINGKWYSVGVSEIQQMAEEVSDSEEEIKTPDLMEQILVDVFGENMEKLGEISGIDDLLDLFTVNIEGGQIVELSSEGLDEVVIPEPTPPQEKTYGTIEPGAKSRPAEETGAAVEEATEEFLDEAA